MTQVDEYDFDEETSKKLNEFFAKAESVAKQIGLSRSAFMQLVPSPDNGGDWAFIIKAAALVENALTFLLTKRTMIVGFSDCHFDEELNDFYSRLPMGGRIGKIKLAKELKLIPKDTADFCERLLEIRNFYAHDLKNLELVIEDFLVKKNDQCEKYFKSFAPFLKNSDEFRAQYPIAALPLFIFFALCAHLQIIKIKFDPPPSFLSSLLSEPEKKELNANK